MKEALQYTDIEKVYDIIKRKGFIQPKLGTASPYWFFFNDSCYELEKQGRIIREKEGRFFWSKKGDVPYGAWRLPNKKEKIEYLKSVRNQKLNQINDESERNTENS